MEQNNELRYLYHLYISSTSSPILQNSVGLILTVTRKSQVSLLDG